jgi:subtilisin-like proprotein convertase family protein
LIEVQDSSGTNGASFSNVVDGNRGRLLLTIWPGPTPDRDGALDNQIIMHELTHGVSGRLHGNSSGLSSNMARGMGEGWSDFYALALLSEPTDNPLGTYTVAGYATYQITPGYEANYYYGIRRFPTAIKASVGANGLPHNPLTFKYLNPNCDALIGTTTTNPNSAFPRNPVISTSSSVQACDQIHNAGELWNVMLWEVRSQLIEQHGAVEGNRRVLQYVTDGMKLAPLNPNMLQERDAILSAAFASDPNDVLPIRRGFAIRGLGYYASIQNPGTGSNNAAVTESFEAVGNVFIAPGFSVSDAPGDGDGFPEAGEPLLLTVPLTNNSGATITDVTAQVAGGGSAAYGSILNGQTVTRQLNFTVPASAPCGASLTLTFNLNSSAGMRSETRSIIIGVPVGGPPVTFTNSTPLTIPAIGTSMPYGTTLNVSGLSGTKKIKLELTGLSHTFPGDLDILLVGPAGQKFVVMSDAVSSFATQTGANVVLKDDAAATLPATGTVNMNGEWKPTDHTTTPADNFPAPAPAAPYQLPAPSGSNTFASVFGTRGMDLNGTWTLYVLDDVSGDSGSLAGWKLTFESDDYICCSCPLAQKRVISTADGDAAVPTCTCISPPRRADFDGDRKSDISVFRPSEGNWYLNQSTAGFGVLNWGTNGDQLAPGDFDGDLKTDFAVFRPNADATQPDFYVLRSSNFTYAGYSWGLPDDVPVIEDYDGDQRSDIAVYRPSNHTFYVLKSFNGSILTYSEITSGTPAAGDFDGDGKGDFAAYSINGWYLSASSANYATVGFTNWGTAGDKPVPADYDGDGKDDFAVFRPSDRTWYIRKSGGGFDFVQFGLANDIPVPGDYDGDLKADVAVYRDGIWYINRSTAGMAIVQFGLSGDVPVANRYLP